MGVNNGVPGRQTENSASIAVADDLSRNTLPVDTLPLRPSTPAREQLTLPPSGTVPTFAHLSDLDQFTVRPGRFSRNFEADTNCSSTAHLYSCPKPFYRSFCGVMVSGKAILYSHPRKKIGCTVSQSVTLVQPTGFMILSS